ncbi:MAG: SDR family NAD(P)-dependent oxidoreductase [Gammaproteobacteria bacterium]|nr:MAG: SDR family NAD(P)-dependent oxidoreductase [Gammaproteobacteria bacterium]
MHTTILRSIALVSLTLAAAPLPAQVESITVDAAAPTQPFPHFWERMFGSGRAVLSLRESYREDLRAVRAVTAVAYVRFHAILHDEVGVYSEDSKGEPVYNFSYIDQIYDGLLANGVRPLIELGFMPRQLAGADIRQSFWYRPVVAPPKDYGRWDALIGAFAGHLVERYGIGEVSRWYFEVWNEPNLDFWGGEPRQSTYWTLYDHTARALKAVDPRLRVGGPATAQAAWVPAFIEHCEHEHVPVDFVSTHVYGDDTAQDVFGTKERIPRERMVCRAVQKVHAEIQASARPSLPLIWTEFNATFANHPEITDALYMGPWLGETIRQCDGLVQDMSYWTFSDVFEEQGVVKTPFYGGFGLLAAGGIPKPAFNAFALLHQLGEQRLASAAEGALLTRRADGALVIALWNYADIGATSPIRKVTLTVKNFDARTASVSITSPLALTRAASCDNRSERGQPVLAVGRAERLSQLAARVRASGEVIETLAADLATPEGVEMVVARARALGDVELLVNNAGLSTSGPFLDQSADREIESIRVNVEALYRLTRAILPGMVARNRGGVLNIASIVAFQAIPYWTTYAATKAFVLAFGEGLAYELRDSGVRVVTVCPGFTSTGLYADSGVPGLAGRLLPFAKPETVVRAALAAYDAGRVVQVVGFVNQLLAVSGALTPRFVLRWLMAQMFAPTAARPG